MKGSEDRKLTAYERSLKWRLVNTPFTIEKLTRRPKGDIYLPRRSVYFSSKPVKRNYIFTTILYIIGAFIFSFLAFRVGSTSSAPIDPLHKTFLAFGLVAYNAIPILWWWWMSQCFHSWLSGTKEFSEPNHPVDKEFEQERFKINGDHAKSVFQLISALTAGLVLKLALGA